MKTFKQFHEDLQSSMATKVGGVPLSAVASRKEGIKRSAELERQSKEPPKNPMKMDDPGSSYAKTSGGVVKFPKQPTPIKLATPAPTSSEPATSPVTAPIKPFQGIKPELKKDGSVQPIQKAVKKEISAPKPPSVNRQVSTMVGNSKAASIRRAAKPESSPMKSSAKPAQEPIKTLPTVNVTARKEKDPNVGGGFVTGYGSASGRTANIKRGFYDVPGKQTLDGIQRIDQKKLPTQRLPWTK